jgi:hypothetical protein
MVLFIGYDAYFSVTSSLGRLTRSKAALRRWSCRCVGRIGALIGVSRRPARGLMTFIKQRVSFGCYRWVGW